MTAKNKQILLIGSTGFIGKNLATYLADKGYRVIASSRNKSRAEKLFEHNKNINVIEWDGKTVDQLSESIADVQIIINLAGENISEKKWTEDRKRALKNSRIEPIQAILKALSKTKETPELIIQASAIGIYGTHNENTFNEESPAGKGYIADLTMDWENEAQKLNDYCDRLVILRTGIVLGKDGGFMKKVMPLLKTGFGGHIGNGKQWMSWIDLVDELKAIDFLISETGSKGFYNLTSPTPMQMKQLFKELAKKVRRRSWLHVPSFAIKLMFGEMGNEILLKGQKVMPDRLINEGFVFEKPQL